MAKEFLSRNNIHYVEKDVNQDMEARRELQRRRISGVPTFLIGDDVVVGLDREKILRLVDHRLATCVNCGQRLRVPTGKGRLQVTCPGCGGSFTVNT